MSSSPTSSLHLATHVIKSGEAEQLTNGIKVASGVANFLSIPYMAMIVWNYNKSVTVSSDFVISDAKGGANTFMLYSTPSSGVAKGYTCTTLMNNTQAFGETAGIISCCLRTLLQTCLKTVP